MSDISCESDWWKKLWSHWVRLYEKRGEIHVTFRLLIYCSSLAILCSIISVIENTNIQIFNQIVFILYRGSVFGWYLTTLTATFPMKYFGRLYGLGVVSNFR